MLSDSALMEAFFKRAVLNATRFSPPRNGAPRPRSLPVSPEVALAPRLAWQSQTSHPLFLLPS